MLLIVFQIVGDALSYGRGIRGLDSGGPVEAAQRDRGPVFVIIGLVAMAPWVGRSEPGSEQGGDAPPSSTLAGVTVPRFHRRRACPWGPRNTTPGI